MYKIFPIIAAAAICIIILCAVFSYIPYFKNEKKLILKKSIILGVSITVFLAIYGIVMINATSYINPPSVISALILTMTCYLGFVISGFIEKENLKKFLKSCSIICVVLFITESVVFNFKSFTSDTTNYVPYMSNAKTDTPETVSVLKDEIVFSGDGNVSFDVYSEDIKALQLEFDGTDTWFGCSAAIKDDNFADQFMIIGEKFASAKYKKCDFSFNSYGELKTIQITLKDVNSQVSLKSCVFRTALPFNFSNIRFIILLVILILLYAVISFKLYRVTYNRKSIKHKIILGFLLVLCSASIFNFYNPKQKAIEYKNLAIETQDPYIQMFDAVHNGRVSIDIEPSQELLDMENPYDSSVRITSGVNFAWDRAFYNGKYYSYYGIAPVLTFYYPYYLITGKLPTINMASVFFAVLAVVFIFGAILSFIKRFIKSPNFILLILLLIASSFTSGIYFLVNYSNMYSLPGIASTCFLMLCLWCGFGACNQQGKRKQPVLFVLCGIAFILCLASRPTKALSALVLAPIFIGFLFSKNIKIKNKISAVISFMVPVLLGFGAIMLYNNARFDSPFDFGAAYQLTVSNVNANSIKLSLLPYAILQYFFQPLGMTNTFPFIDFTALYYGNYGQFIYNDRSVGALTYPLLLTGILILPFWLFHTRRKNGKIFTGSEMCIKRYTYITAILLAIGVAWLNFSMAGIILSYTFDILPIITLLSIFVVLETQQLTAKIPCITNKSVCAFSIIIIITILLVFLELLTLHDLAIYKRFPNIMFELENLICFWN